MKRTNLQEAPEKICRLVDSFEGSHPDVANISCTTLIDSPLIRMLKKRYYDTDELTVDYSDDLWKIAGSIVHYIIEAVEKNSTRIPTLIIPINGWTVSGTTDSVESLVFNEGVLRDYKFTSAYTIQKAMKEGKGEWEKQLNVYRYMILNTPELKEKMGDIKSMEIVAWDRDWGPRFKKDNLHPIETIPVPIWKDDQATKRWIEERVMLHQLAEQSDQPACCTDTERWASPQVFAAMKKGRQSAIRKCSSQEEADEVVKNTPGGYVEVRPKEFKRCISYCAYGRCGLCPYWRKEDCK